MKISKFSSGQTVKILALVAFFLSQNVLTSQVATRILQQGENFEDYILWYSMQSPSSFDVPPIDVQAVLHQDSIEGREVARFGIKQAVNLTQADGTFYEFGNFDVWKLVVHSDGAQSLNFEFVNLNLPNGSEMFVYGSDSKVIFGPVRPQNVRNGSFATDIVAGETAIIEVFLPENSLEVFDIEVTNVIHGIKNQKVSSRAFGDSEDCNINTVCPQGAVWGNEIGAVCLILVNGEGYCSGSLINNDCSDFTPYVLTASHCTEDFSNFDNWVFRFRYESATCPEAVDPVTYFSFTGAQLRASWETTDFALLELGDPVDNFNVSFAGWNRSSTPPLNNPVSIHHPEGDVKKISLDDEPAGEWGDDEWLIEDFAQGTLEHGSSGGPLFDDNHLIVGQVWATLENILGCNGIGSLFSRYTFGKFDVSWDGGGTDGTRLSTWLGGGIADPMTMQGVLVPTIFGGNILCATSQTYTLQNPAPGYTITWSVTPVTLFGSPTSGTGANATLWASNNFVSGEATLTYTLTNPNCGAQTITRTIWVGRPATPIIQAPECFIPGSNVVVRAIAPGATNYSWSLPNCPSGTPVGDPTPGCWFNYTGNGPSASNILVHVGEQSGSISVFTSNACGTSSVNLPVTFCGGGEPGGGIIIRSNPEQPTQEEQTSRKVLVFPNPTNGGFAVELNPQFYPSEEGKYAQLINLPGKIVYENDFTGNALTINAKNAIPVVYFLKVRYQGHLVVEKIIIY